MNSRTATPLPRVQVHVLAVLHHRPARHELALDLHPGARLRGQVALAHRRVRSRDDDMAPPGYAPRGRQTGCHREHTQVPDLLPAELLDLLMHGSMAAGRGPRRRTATPGKSAGGTVLQFLRPNVHAARADSSQNARVSDDTSTRPLREWAPIVAERLFRRPEVRRVIVFGSVERGEEGPESDLDLLVVLDHVENSHDDAVRMLNELRPLPIPVDVLVTDDVRLETQSKHPGVVRVALREGRVIERAA